MEGGGNQFLDRKKFRGGLFMYCTCVRTSGMFFFLHPCSALAGAGWSCINESQSVNAASASAQRVTTIRGGEKGRNGYFWGTNSLTDSSWESIHPFSPTVVFFPSPPKSTCVPERERENIRVVKRGIKGTNKQHLKVNLLSALFRKLWVVTNILAKQSSCTQKSPVQRLNKPSDIVLLRGHKAGKESREICFLRPRCTQRTNSCSYDEIL